MAYAKELVQNISIKIGLFYVNGNKKEKNEKILKWFESSYAFFSSTFSSEIILGVAIIQLFFIAIYYLEIDKTFRM